jgi:hypothetical protein
MYSAPLLQCSGAPFPSSALWITAPCFVSEPSGWIWRVRLPYYFSFLSTIFSHCLHTSSPLVSSPPRTTLLWKAPPPWSGTSIGPPLAPLDSLIFSLRINYVNLHVHDTTALSNCSILFLKPYFFVCYSYKFLKFKYLYCTLVAYLRSFVILSFLFAFMSLIYFPFLCCFILLFAYLFLSV